MSVKRPTSRFTHLRKLRLNFSSSSFVLHVNLLHPSPPSSIRNHLQFVPFWFIIIPLVFFHLIKLFSEFLQFNGNSVQHHNNQNCGFETKQIQILMQQKSGTNPTEWVSGPTQTSKAPSKIRRRNLETGISFENEFNVFRPRYIGEI